MNQRIGLFGGAFNPPHNGHVAAARQAFDALALDRLYVMPTGISPHKRPPTGTPPAAARLAMTGLAFAGLAGCVVSDWELAHPGESYTIHTLDWLQARHPEASLVLIVGTDMFLSLHTWYQAEDVMAAARIAVLARDVGRQCEVAAQAAFLAHRFDAAIDIVPHTPVEVSSSELRNMLRQGEGQSHLPEEVYQYIVKRGLYTAKGE